MWLINFADLRDRNPHLSDAFNAIESWLKKHPRIRHIEPVRVLRSCPTLDPWELSVAFALLVDIGWLKPVYGVVAPNQTLSKGFYDSVREIPETLYDTFDEPFQRDEGELVTVYREKK
jgi:hypothetical protein